MINLTALNENSEYNRSLDKSLDRSRDKSQDSVGPGSYDPKLVIKNKKGVVGILPFKSKVNRFATKPKESTNVDLDLIKYSSFNPKPDQHPSPTF